MVAVVLWTRRPRIRDETMAEACMASVEGLSFDLFWVVLMCSGEVIVNSIEEG
jgi:hypothetical protein